MLHMYFFPIKGDEPRLDVYGHPYRSKQEHPYNYSPFYLFMANGATKNPGRAKGVYSDRLHMWASRDEAQAKAEGLEKESGTVVETFGERIDRIFGRNTGDYYPRREPDKVEEFLRLQLKKPELRLLGIREECNIGNGFPLWYFEYEDLAEAE